MHKDVLTGSRSTLSPKPVSAKLQIQAVCVWLVCVPASVCLCFNLFMGINIIFVALQQSGFQSITNEFDRFKLILYMYICT